MQGCKKLTHHMTDGEHCRCKGGTFAHSTGYGVGIVARESTPYSLTGRTGGTTASSYDVNYSYS